MNSLSPTNIQDKASSGEHYKHSISYMLLIIITLLLSVKHFHKGGSSSCSNVSFSVSINNKGVYS